MFERPEPTYVAIDLETTGLQPLHDRITEIGAVRVTTQGEVLGEFESLVNPGRDIPPFVQALTGITDADVRDAPSAAEAGARLLRFIGDATVVGHNIGFDLAFLRREGIGIDVPAVDTAAFSRLLMPARQPRGLSELAATLGIPGTEFHRALADAKTAAFVFAKLCERLGKIPEEQRRHLAMLVGIENPGIARLLAGDLEPDGGFSPAWLPTLRQPESHSTLVRKDPLVPVSAEKVKHAYSFASRAMYDFEDRPQQVRMVSRIGEAFAAGGQHLIEAGTGVGKSMAYLLSAALHALQNEDRVVVSTNTINLQEQILGKDIPQLRRMLVEAGVIKEEAELRVSLLKGRGNYLCLRRFAANAVMAAGDPDFAHLNASMYLWLQETETGDRSELSLDHTDYVTWPRVSAAETDCLARQNTYVRDGSCFLLRARKAAEAAHIIVVNHALLLADLVSNGSAIPAFQNLVIDEAHNLEEVATRQFGALHSRRRMGDALDAVHRPAARDHREGGVAALLLSLPEGPQHTAGGKIADLVHEAGLLSLTFFTALGELTDTANGAEDERVRITHTVRNSDTWTLIDAAWEPLAGALAKLSLSLLDASAALATTAKSDDPDALAGEVAGAARRIDEVRSSIGGLLASEQTEFVTWVARESDGTGSLNAAPLDAGPMLAEQLFAKKRTVIATSATLSAAGDMRYMARRLGLGDAETLELGSPFDYRASTLLTAFNGVPEPNEPGYDAGVAEAIVKLTRASEGRALGLFTSHAALRRVAALVRPALEDDGITVLVQGIDGNPRRLTEHLIEHPQSLVLGTQSFWEGVDIRGQALSLLIIARLPFAVPTDPVYVARSELFDDSFNDYALPNAILRFRQGFGRLIRSQGDRGVVAILDGRIRSKRYGDQFLRSLPACSKFASDVDSVAVGVAQWLAD